MSKLRRSATGELILPGRIQRRLYEPMIPGAVLPSWLEVSVGTATYTQITSGSAPGSVRAVTGSTVNAASRIRTTFQFIPSQYQAVMWKAYGFRFDADSNFFCRFEINETTLTEGVAITHDSAATYATLRGYRAAGTFQDTTTNFALMGPHGAGRKPRNIALLWLIADNMAYVLEDDQVVASAVVDEAGKSASRPMITMATNEAVSHYFQASAFEFVLTHN